MNRIRILTVALGLAMLTACSGPHDLSRLQTPPAAPASPGPPDNSLQQQLRAELDRVLQQRGIELDAAGQPLRAVSAIPKRNYIVPSRFNNIITGSAELEWPHFQTGDYDQNGEVNISDLTPVGIHIGKDSSSPDWNKAQTADGDGNGVINISDVTPIGQNFGAVVGGYVVQSRRTAQDEYADYGFVSFSSGFDTGALLEFGYTAPGNADFDSFRVSPVAPTREFSWNVYRMDFPTSMSTHPTLATFNNKPIMTWVDWDNTSLMYARALVSRPASPSEWDTHAIDSDQVIADQPGLAVVNGLPAIAYNGLDVTLSNHIRFARALVTEPTNGGDWQHHVITAGLPVQPLTVLEKNQLPVVTVGNGTGRIFLGVTPTPLPTMQSDWASVGINGSATLTAPDICLVGNRVALASYDYGATPGVYYSNATANTPSGPSDFVNFPLQPLGGSIVRSSVATIGGLPHVCAPNEANGTLDYLRSGETYPNSAAVWFLHPVFTDPTDILAPELTMLDGKPLLAFGRFNLNLAWSRIEQADDPADWLLNEELEGGLNFGVGSIGLTVTDNLPVIAFVHYDAVNSIRDIAIAIASEK